MNRRMAIVLCMLMAYVAAANAGDIRKTAEATMLVTGSIDVAPDGSVHGYSIDRPEKIPPVVVDLIKNSVPGWRFQFAERVDAVQHAKMSLRIIAKPVDDQHEVLHLVGASFGHAGADGARVTYKNMQPPRYPQEAIREHVGGTVFLLLRIDRQGQVQNLAVEQVNLGSYGREAQMRHFRSVLGDAALEAAKGWTFNPPTTGKNASAPYWDMRAPVNFDPHPIGTSRADTYGKWEAYIPGPRASIPWAASNQSTSDAVPVGTLSQAEQPMQLKTALDGA
ncbi:MAG TPA: energy transducer TonB [Dyella sp.]|uniref:energy transducer TonB n=1 Tax=Dyella sp. TaxID=1869338 RepID=UPI002C251FA9|nr:energy transducer TonB [Dyella sp.]HUB88514.1 energy transducer TonB [Dyella sp.]